MYLKLLILILLVIKIDFDIFNNIILILSVLSLFFFIKNVEGIRWSGGPSPEYKSFYGYFGREKNENNENDGDVIPYYIPTNIDLGDLKGELSFFKNEFLKYPTENKRNRKYGINYIDKWLFRYNGKLGNFISFEDNRIGQADDEQLKVDKLYNLITDDIKNGRFIGTQKQDEGNWMSIIGKCPNKTRGNKGGKKCKIPNEDKVKVVDINDINKAIPTSRHPIIAIYIGTLRLDDIVKEGRDDCSNNFKKIYKKHSYEGWSGIDDNSPDRESPFWKNLLDNSIADSLTYKVLNDPDTFKCRLVNKNEYKLTDNVEIPDKIYKIESNNLVEIPDEGRDSNNCDPKNDCNSRMWYCEEGKSYRGCKNGPFPLEDCVKQCFKNI